MRYEVERVRNCVDRRKRMVWWVGGEGVSAGGGGWLVVKVEGGREENDDFVAHLRFNTRGRFKHAQQIRDSQCSQPMGSARRVWSAWCTL